MIRALIANEPIRLRYPEAVRPWQHALDVNAGYLRYIETLSAAPADTPRACNFGPADTTLPTVREVIEQLGAMFEIKRDVWLRDPGNHPPEASLLRLDVSLAKQKLGWHPRLSCQEAIAWTADWYAAWQRGSSPLEVTRSQIAAYLERRV